MSAAPVFVFGATSMPGWNLIRSDRGRGLVPFCSPHVDLPACRTWKRFNLEDEDAYRMLFDEYRPGTIIHCGGICDVEKCEADPSWAKRINVRGLERLLKHIPRGIRLVYVSSDHVFGGGEAPFDEDAPTCPISVYGRTRVEAERLVLAWGGNRLVVRFALGIGPSIDGRSGHLDWLRHRAGRGLPITIVAGETRSAVLASDLALRIMDLAESGVAGLRHVAAERPVSREELARSLIAEHGLGVGYALRPRASRPAPHLGRVELATRYAGKLAAPLPSPVRFSARRAASL